MAPPQPMTRRGSSGREELSGGGGPFRSGSEYDLQGTHLINYLKGMLSANAAPGGLGSFSSYLLGGSGVLPQPHGAKEARDGGALLHRPPMNVPVGKVQT